MVGTHRDCQPVREEVVSEAYDAGLIDQGLVYDRRQPPAIEAVEPHAHLDDVVCSN